MYKKMVTLLLAVGVLCLSGCSCEHFVMREEVVKEATCTENGVAKKICESCGYSYEVAIESGHDLDWSGSVVIKEPTCTEDGKEALECSKCGWIREIPISARHDIKNGRCSACGYKEPLPKLSVGMSMSQVRAKWGEPLDIDSVTDARGSSETWWYKENGNLISVHFGNDGRVQLITS